MAYYLLPQMKQLHAGDSPLVIWLKRWDAKLLHWSFGHARRLLAGAAALACDHLAALWTPRPIFGPGELSTTHVDMYRKFKQAANDWRAIDATAGGLSGDETPPGSVVKVSAFNFMETAP
jgi:hypothetical protein